MSSNDDTKWWKNFCPEGMDDNEAVEHAVLLSLQEEKADDDKRFQDALRMSLAETKKNCLAASNLPDEFPSSSNAIAGNNLSTYCNNTSMHIANGASAHYSNNVTHNHMETEDTNPCHLKASEVNNVLVSKIVNGSNNVYGAKNIHRSGSVENFMAQNQSSRRQDDSWLNGLHQNEDISNYDYFLANSRLITLSEDDPVFCQIEGDFIENNLLVTRICELKNSALLERFELEAGLMINQNPDLSNLNVHLFYHGSNAPLRQLCEEGLDERLSRNGRFGCGIYFSDNPRNCIKYSQKYREEHLGSYMLRCRVILGDVKEYEPGIDDITLVKEPIKNIVNEVCTYYNSVKGKPKSDSTSADDHMEYVIFDKRRAFIEHIIFYCLPDNSSSAPKCLLDSSHSEDIPLKKICANNSVQSKNNGVQSTNNGVQSTNNGVQSTNNGVQSTNNGVQSTNNGVQSTNNGVQSTNSGVQSTNNGVQSTNNGVQSTNNGVQSTNNGVQSTKHETNSNEFHNGITGGCESSNSDNEDKMRVDSALSETNLLHSEYFSGNICTNVYDNNRADNNSVTAIDEIHGNNIDAHESSSNLIAPSQHMDQGHMDSGVPENSPINHPENELRHVGHEVKKYCVSSIEKEKNENTTHVVSDEKLVSDEKVLSDEMVALGEKVITDEKIVLLDKVISDEKVVVDENVISDEKVANEAEDKNSGSSTSSVLVPSAVPIRTFSVADVQKSLASSHLSHSREFSSSATGSLEFVEIDETECESMDESASPTSSKQTSLKARDEENQFLRRVVRDMKLLDKTQTLTDKIAEDEARIRKIETPDSPDSPECSSKFTKSTRSENSNSSRFGQSSLLPSRAILAGGRILYREGSNINKAKSLSSSNPGNKLKLKTPSTVRFKSNLYPELPNMLRMINFRRLERGHAAKHQSLVTEMERSLRMSETEATAARTNTSSATVRNPTSSSAGRSATSTNAPQNTTSSTSALQSQTSNVLPRAVSVVTQSSNTSYVLNQSSDNSYVLSRSADSSRDISLQLNRALNTVISQPTIATSSSLNLTVSHPSVTLSRSPILQSEAQSLLRLTFSSSNVHLRTTTATLSSTIHNLSTATPQTQPSVVVLSRSPLTLAHGSTYFSSVGAGSNTASSPVTIVTSTTASSTMPNQSAANFPVAGSQSITQRRLALIDHIRQTINQANLHGAGIRIVRRRHRAREAPTRLTTSDIDLPTDISENSAQNISQSSIHHRQSSVNVHGRNQNSVSRQPFNEAGMLPLFHKEIKKEPGLSPQSPEKQGKTAGLLPPFHKDIKKEPGIEPQSSQEKDQSAGLLSLSPKEIKKEPGLEPPSSQEKEKSAGSFLQSPKEIKKEPGPEPQSSQGKEQFAGLLSPSPKEIKKEPGKQPQSPKKKGKDASLLLTSEEKNAGTQPQSLKEKRKDKGVSSPSPKKRRTTAFDVDDDDESENDILPLLLENVFASNDQASVGEIPSDRETSANNQNSAANESGLLDLDKLDPEFATYIDELVQNFLSIANITESEVAYYYIVNADYDLDRAIEAFFRDSSSS